MPGNFQFSWTIIYQVPTQRYVHKDMGWGSWLLAVHNHISVQTHVLLEIGCTGTKADKPTRSQRSNIEIGMAVNFSHPSVWKTKGRGGANRSWGQGSPGVTRQGLKAARASLGELKTQSGHRGCCCLGQLLRQREGKKCSGFALLSLPSLSILSCWLNPEWSSCTRTWEMERGPALLPHRAGEGEERVCKQSVRLTSNGEPGQGGCTRCWDRCG